MSSRNKRWILGIVFFNAVALPVLWSIGHPKFIGTEQSVQEQAPLPEYGQLPDFELIREDGSAFSAKDMRGGLWVADFIFTRCPHQCPMMSAQFAVLQAKLPSDVRLASFSVDPANDTPEVFKKYAANYGAKPERWAFVTGDAASLRRLKEAAHLGNGDDPNLHSLRFVLLDQKLRMRGYYDSMDKTSVDKIKRDVEQLKGEK